jgi:hypothetical protein
LDEDIRAGLEGHPPTTGDLPVQQVLNVDLLDVAVIGDPNVPALAPDPSGQGRIRPLGIAGNPDTGQLEAATSSGTVERPCRVFHFGAIGPTTRVALS